MRKPEKKAAACRPIRSPASRRRQLQETTGTVSGVETSNRLPSDIRPTSVQVPVPPLTPFMFTFLHLAEFFISCSKSRRSNPPQLGSATQSTLSAVARLKSMVANCVVLPPSCPPTCPLHPWGRTSHLCGTPRAMSGCVFENSGMSCKFNSLSLLVSDVHVLSLCVWLCS